MYDAVRQQRPATLPCGLALLLLAAAVGAGACGRESLSAEAAAGEHAAALGADDPEVSESVLTGSSPALRDLPPSPTSGGRVRARVKAHRPPGPPIHDTGPEAALQGEGPQPAAPAVALGFEGMGNGLGADFDGQMIYIPPDTNAAVGPNHIVQTVNASLAVWDKSGNRLYGPVFLETLWINWTESECWAHNDGDPIVKYDQLADRWLISQFAVAGVQEYHECVAVSKTADPLGEYHLYDFRFGRNMPDYPKFAVWPGAYLATYNLFLDGRTFAGSRACAYDRAAMLTGASPVTQVCWTLISFGSLLPVDLDGFALPPAGAPALLANITSGRLNLWRLKVPDWAAPGTATLSGAIPVSVAGFAAACGDCITQPAPGEILDALGDRLMYRASYRNFGTHESLVASHSVTARDAKVRGKRQRQVGVRWYEVRGLTSGTPLLHQQGTFAPNDRVHRWMPSVAMDRLGNIAVGYSASSGTEGVHPGIRFTGRTPADAAGTMQAETRAVDGTGSQTANRWGDYSSMVVDPADDCTFWFTTEYLATTGAWNWHTRILSFRMAGCTPP